MNPIPFSWCLIAAGVIALSSFAGGVRYQEGVAENARLKAQESQFTQYRNTAQKQNTAASKTETEQKQNEANRPTVTVVSGRVCANTKPVLSSTSSGVSESSPGTSSSPELGEAFKHDADRYPFCVTALNGAIDQIEILESSCKPSH